MTSIATAKNAAAAKPVRFSILLPTLRRKLFEATLHSIYANSVGHDYEIIVVSPFPIEGEAIKWIEERKAGGCIRAFADAYAQSSGDIILAMTDDTMALPGWLDAVDKWITRGEEKYMPYCIGLNRVTEPKLGTVFGKYYGYFPAISRKSIEAAGGFFYDPAYIGNWADPDLGMRVWAAGGRVEFWHEAHIFPVRLQALFTEAVHKSGGYFVKDSELFYRRWHHIAPVGHNGPYFRDVNADFHNDMAQDNTILLKYRPADAKNNTDAALKSRILIFKDIMGYDLHRCGYADMTADILAVPQDSMKTLIGPEEKRFPTVQEACSWLTSTMNLPLTENVIGSQEITKLTPHQDVEACCRILAMQIEGMNCASHAVKLVFIKSFLGRPLFQFVVNGKVFFAASTRSDVTDMSLGSLLFTRMHEVFFGPRPDEVMKQIVLNIVRSGRFNPIMRRVVSWRLTVFAIITFARIMRLAGRLFDRKNGKLLRMTKKAVWKIILMSWNGADNYRYETSWLDIPETSL